MKVAIDLNADGTTRESWSSKSAVKKVYYTLVSPLLVVDDILYTAYYSQLGSVRRFESLFAALRLSMV